MKEEALFLFQETSRIILFILNLEREGGGREEQLRLQLVL